MLVEMSCKTWRKSGKTSWILLNPGKVLNLELYLIWKWDFYILKFHMVPWDDKPPDGHR
jgi:hypothetical protein